MKLIVKEDAVNTLFDANNKYKIPNDIYSNLSKHFTSLGNNKAFPDEEKYSFDYQIIKERYKEIVDKLGEMNIQFGDLSELRSMLSRMMTDCIKREKPIRDILNKLCEKTVKDMLFMPPETILFRCILVDKVEPKKMPRIMPEDNIEQEYSFNDVDEKFLTNSTVMKRRFVNSLVQGAAYSLYTQSKGSFMNEVFKMDDTLPKMYEAIIAINDFLLFNQEIKYNDKENRFTAHVDVTLGAMDKKTKIEAQAVIFPFLLIESFRGCCELFAAHGLPKEDKDKLKYIINKADYKTAEQWDLRFGVKLWQMLANDIQNTAIYPYFISELSSMETDEFNNSVKEMLSNTKKGQEIKNDLIKYCERNVSFDDMPQDMSQTSDDMKAIIVDDSNNDNFTIEELSNLKAEDFFLNEYKGEQLVLPFDGNSHAYNDMQFIDYLIHNSVGKTLKTKIRNIEDFFETLTDSDLFAVAKASFMTGPYGDELSRTRLLDFVNTLFDVKCSNGVDNLFEYDFLADLFKQPIYNFNRFCNMLIDKSNDRNVMSQIFVEKGRKELAKLFGKLTINEDGLIYCERGIVIPDAKDHSFQLEYENEDNQFYSHLNFYHNGRLGVSWSYEPKRGYAYESSLNYTYDCPTNHIVLKGYTRFEDVNWKQTIAQNDADEYELTLKSGGLVQINEIRLRRTKALIKADYPFVVKA